MADELLGFKEVGVSCVISLLEPAEVSELGLNAEESMCRDLGIDFVSYPIADRGVPENLRSFAELVHDISERALAEDYVTVHCRAGIGRSGLVAAAVLVLNNFSVDDAFAAISKARGVAVPDTEEQYEWLTKNSNAIVLGI